MRTVSNLFAVCLVLALPVLGTPSWLGQVCAEPLPGQEGLPPELTIPAEPELDDQIDDLEDLAKYAKRNAPETGFVASLKNLFSGTKKPRLINIDLLAANVSELKGTQIVVEGIYEVRGEEEAIFRSEGATCHLTLAGGTQPEGFPDSGPDGLPARVEGTVEMGEQGLPLIRVQQLTPALALSFIRLGRAYELDEEYEDAVEAYSAGAVAGVPTGYKYAAFARIHAAELALEELDDGATARRLYDAAWTGFAATKTNAETGYYTWTRPANAQTWQKQPVGEAIREPLDSLKRGGFWYGLVNAFVRIAGGNPAFGVLLLAVVTRLMIYPLTKKQLVSMRAMQKIQPRIKELQKKHKDNKQKFQEEFWKLCKEHNVNPLGGCLPLLVQMPILIMIYRGIRDYAVQFDGASFLWVKNLAQPDIYLLVAYTISMIGFQKMTQRMNPAAAMDPQQASQQQMMTYMMPLLFFFMFQSFPAAFILYWLGTNLVYFTEQYLFLHLHRENGGDSANRGNGGDSASGGKKTSGGFAAAMAKIVSGAGAKKEAKTEGKPQSYEETKAAAGGKKVGKEDKRRPAKRRG